MNILSKEQVNLVIKSLNAPVKEENYGFIYDVYTRTITGITELNDANVFSKINGVNNFDIISYICGEYVYLTRNFSDEKIKEFNTDENSLNTVASFVADKYLSFSMFNYHEKKLTNKYLPPVSTLNLYYNFILNVLNTYQQNDPSTTLVIDLLVKSISISRCVLNLLVDGYFTEAFATWRTLHECECTIILLNKHGQGLIDTYLKHMKYAIAYKNGIANKEEQDQIFVQIKKEMADHGLKSKDMKKYIEYGWLYDLKEFNDLPNGKLNFKDGLEVVSGLDAYGTSYNISSEIVHATPLMLYANNSNLYITTLILIYESFFRLEKIFIDYIMPRVNKNSLDVYLKMRKLYYSYLVRIYNSEKSKLTNNN